MRTKQKKRITMWYKVQELTATGLNKSQIRLETGLDRATIRKYQEMDEDAFHHWIARSNCLPLKLKDYREQVKKMLERAPYLSSAQGNLNFCTFTQIHNGLIGWSFEIPTSAYCHPFSGNQRIMTTIKLINDKTDYDI